MLSAAMRAAELLEQRYTFQKLWDQVPLPGEQRLYPTPHARVKGQLLLQGYSPMM